MFTLRRERNLQCYYFYSISLTVRLHEEKAQRMVKIFQRNNIFRFF